jgi:hypothetical protein
MALAAGIGLDHARIDRESFAANQLLIDTARFKTCSNTWRNASESQS